MATTTKQPTTTDELRALSREALNFELPEDSLRWLAALMPHAGAADTDPGTLARDIIGMCPTDRALLCKVMAMERVMLTTHDHEMLRDLLMTQQDQIAALQAEVKALRGQPGQSPRKGQTFRGKRPDVLPEKV